MSKTLLVLPQNGEGPSKMKMGKKHNELFSAPEKKPRGRKDDCKNPSQYQILCEAQVQMKIELTLLVFRILKFQGHMLVLGEILGKKQGLLRQKFPAFEESQNKEDLQFRAQFLDEKYCVYKAPSYPDQRKGAHAILYYHQAGCKEESSPSRDRMMKTLRVILTELSDSNHQAFCLVNPPSTTTPAPVPTPGRLHLKLGYSSVDQGHFPN